MVIAVVVHLLYHSWRSPYFWKEEGPVLLVLVFGFQALLATVALALFHFVNILRQYRLYRD